MSDTRNFDFDDEDEVAGFEDCKTSVSQVPPPLSSSAYTTMKSTTMARLEAVLKLTESLANDLYRIESGPFGRCDSSDLEDLVGSVVRAREAFKNYKK